MFGGWSGSRSSDSLYMHKLLKLAIKKLLRRVLGVESEKFVIQLEQFELRET